MLLNFVEKIFDTTPKKEKKEKSQKFHFFSRKVMNKRSIRKVQSNGFSCELKGPGTLASEVPDLSASVRKKYPLEPRVRCRSPPTLV